MFDDGVAPTFILLCFVLLWMTLRGIVKGRSVYEFPTLAAFMGIAWVVPQGIELETSPTKVYDANEFWLYVLFCFFFVFIAFRSGLRNQLSLMRSKTYELPRYSPEKLLDAAAVLTAVGWVSVLLMRGVDTSSMGGQWTGVATMYFLFSKCLGFGLCLSVLVYVFTPSRRALIIAILAAYPVLAGALFVARREDMFDVAILTVGAWYLAKRRNPPRVATILLLIVGIVVVNTAGNIRSRISEEGSTLFSVIFSLDTYQQFNYFALDQGLESEVGQAQYDFWRMNETWEWEYGADYWNTIVHQYVPAFLVGTAVKDYLRFETFAERLRRGDAEGLYSIGSTRTGFSDSYRNFGAFGILVFAAIGYLFGIWFAVAISGGIWGQYLYLVLLAEGLKSITHSTSEFFSALPFVVLCCYLAFSYAKLTPSKN